MLFYIKKYIQGFCIKVIIREIISMLALFESVFDTNVY